MPYKIKYHSVDKFSPGNKSFVQKYRVAPNLCGSLILQMDDFCVLRKLIFMVGKIWFLLLGINFCDFQEVAFYLEL